MKEEELVTEYDRIIINSNSSRFFLVAMFIILAYYFGRYIDALNTYGFLESRSLRFTVGTVFSNILEAHFFNYVITAGNYVNLFIIAFSVVFGRVRSLIFAVACANALLFAGIGSGRGILIAILFFILFVFLLKKNRPYLYLP